MFYNRYIHKQFQCVKKMKIYLKDKSKGFKLKRKHKYDDLHEVIIPKNVDLDDENIQSIVDIVNP